jgi:hypothetical protein
MQRKKAMAKGSRQKRLDSAERRAFIVASIVNLKGEAGKERRKTWLGGGKSAMLEKCKSCFAERCWSSLLVLLWFS